MRYLALIILLLIQQPSAAAETLPSTDKSNLTILVDDRLLMALAPLVRNYAVTNKTPLTVVLKDATSAESQIEQGLEAHVLLTANRPLIESLTNQGLTDVTSRRTIARTQLALVSTKALSRQAQLAKRISFAAMLYATPNLPIYVNQPESYEGARIGQLLSGGYEFSTALDTRMQPQANPEEVLDAVRDSDGLALIFTTDASLEPDISILALVPDNLSPPLTFDAVVLGSESMNEAKEFVSYLTSRQAQRTLSHFGFQPLN